MLQDTYYSKHYTKVLALEAAKAVHEEDIQYFLDAAKFIHKAELVLSPYYLQIISCDNYWRNWAFWGIPAAYNYVSHVYNAVYNLDIAEAFATILPCL